MVTLERSSRSRSYALMGISLVEEQMLCEGKELLKKSCSNGCVGKKFLVKKLCADGSRARPRPISFGGCLSE